MEGDIFTSSSKNMYDKRLEEDNNFFLQPEQISYGKNSSEPSRHLNDYDFNILKEDAYKDIKDEVFKLEYKIARLENDIKSLDVQIQAANDIKDYILVNNLVARKKQMQLDLEGLNEIYNDTSLSTRISGGMSGKIKERFLSFKKTFITLTDSILTKIPGKMSSFVELKNSLEKLENINKSVDELMSIQIPYGESFDKYDQLSKYIVRANNIQANISKFWK